MNCEELERWLDEGMDAEGSAAARAHVATCARCAAMIDAADDVDALLAAFSTPAPAGFTGRVMARVAQSSEVAAYAAARSPFAWWIEVAAQPATALAALLAALVLWKRDALIAVAARFASNLDGALLRVLTTSLPIRAPFDRPEVLLGLCVAAIPAAAWGSWMLYRWTERFVRAPLTRRPAHG